MKPETLIFTSAMSCLVVGLALFATGYFAGVSPLKDAGAWFVIGAFAIASLPLIAFAAVAIVEKFQRR